MRTALLFVPWLLLVACHGEREACSGPRCTPTVPGFDAAIHAADGGADRDAVARPSPDAAAVSPDARDAGAPPPACPLPRPAGHYQMEDLDRGLVAVRTDAGNFLSWRMLGYEYEPVAPERLAYRVYRDGIPLATVVDSTNYVDSAPPSAASYEVSLVFDGVECPRSRAVQPWTSPFLEIPLEAPPAGVTPSGEGYAYDTGTTMPSSGGANDTSPGDLDGDGQYELVVLWSPSNAKDNSQSGYTGSVYLDGYELGGERLWRIDLGRNIRAGAHYTQFVVYDLDGDGRAEVTLKTAPGTRDGSGEYLRLGPAASDDDELDYRDASGRVLRGPEYLTVFDGTTGVELTTVDFEIARGAVAAWGDDYGNRVDRFLASAAFVSDMGGAGAGSGRPLVLMARGYYTRATVTAWAFREGTLERVWTADSDVQGAGALIGQGAHSMAVADVDGDLAQELIYGSAMIQSDGSFGCSTALYHGDALHVTDLVPSRPGLEVFMPHEHRDQPWWDVHDARTCELIQVATESGKDVGRGVAADVDGRSPGAEFWSTADAELRSATSGEVVGRRPASINFLVWWDGDELRELEDGVTITRADGTPLLTCSDCVSNNYTKSTPNLTADLLGDWREEVVWRSPTSDALRVFTTTHVTSRRLPTLMHDPQYRMQVSSEMTGYNQPPHTSYFLGQGMEPPVAPDIHVR